MSLSKEAIRKLKQIKACILAEPELYNQGVFPLSGRHTCETPCCIAGWAVWVNNPDEEAYNSFLSKKSFSSVVLAEQLEVTEEQARLLFSEWGTEDGPAWTRPGTKEAAKDGAARIDRFIESGGTI